jgi:hypothetical protein
MPFGASPGHTACGGDLMDHITTQLPLALATPTLIATMLG